MTLKVSTQSLFEELILSQEDSRANRIALQECVKRLVTSVTYGQRCGELYAKRGQDGSWQKTSQDCLALSLEDSSPEWSMTWCKWGTAWGGECTELRTLVQFIEESGYSSSLGTPTANDAKNSITESQRGRGTLTADLLPTPTLQIAKGGLSGAMMKGVKIVSYSLNSFLLPTPRASKISGYASPNYSPTLEQKLLATPAAADCQGSHVGGQGRSLRTDIYNYKAETGEHGQLNPSFVEAMMGFPTGWTDLGA